MRKYCLMIVLVISFPVILFYKSLFRHLSILAFCLKFRIKLVTLHECLNPEAGFAVPGYHM